MGQSSIVSTDTFLHFNVVHNPLAPRKYIDLAQCLSIVNRRSYRQGMNYAVASIEVFAPSSGFAQVFTVPTTWVADNATTKAFEAWKDQRAEVLKEQPSLKAKWSDFKIFLDSTHATAGVGGNLTPLDGSGNAYALGEWDMSQYVTPLPGADQAASGDAHELVFHVVGDHIPTGDFTKATASVGLIKAYAASRALPLTPDPATEGQYITGFYNMQQSEDEKSQDIMANVTDRNDNPPYSTSEYPGSDVNAPTAQLFDVMIVRNWGDATTSSSDSVGSFVAPFGLICLNFASGFEADDDIGIKINLVPGNYKGVLAERGV